MHGFRRVKAGVALALLTVGVSAGAGPSGAIFTTDVTGSFVNGNVYDHPGDVYLNGGPRANAPCTAAGLPDDDYYFQVTDPSGQEVLSTDPLSERKFHVAGGVITAYFGTTHGTGTGKCMASIPTNITVQLCPFDQTLNQGDEYKVWVTSAAYQGAFSRSVSKTDNFKVTGADLCPPGD